MRAERLKFNLLCEQSLATVWRKNAFKALVQGHDKMGTTDRSQFLAECLDVFRERVHFAVDNSKLQTKEVGEKVCDMVAAHVALRRPE